MGKKYIIELEDNESVYKTIISNGYPMIQIIVPAPYVKPNLEQVQKKAYDNGYETAKRECEDCPKQAYTDTLRMDVYQKGLSDAWDAARKVVALSTVDRRKVFGSEYMYSILEKHTASDAINKLKAYEQKQDEIQVGDEVTMASGKAVVTGVGPVHFEYVYADGSHGYDKVKNVKKTGRHFPEIAKVMQKMRETE